MWRIIFECLGAPSNLNSNTLPFTCGVYIQNEGQTVKQKEGFLNSICRRGQESIAIGQNANRYNEKKPVMAQSLVQLDALIG